VFSDVYAVLNKNWTENHHDRLCEILEKVERECGVEICFVKGAYQFRGALKALSNVLTSLQSESDREQSLAETTDVAQGSAQQHGELPNGEDPALLTSEGSSGSDAILTQSNTCGEGNVLSGAYASDVKSSRACAAGNDNLETSTNESKLVNKRMQHEDEQQQQAESVSLSTSVDHQGNIDPPAKTMDSVSDLTERQNHPNDSNRAAVNQEQRHDDRVHHANNALPHTDASPSLSSYITIQTSGKDALTSHSDVDASARCDTQQSERRSTSSTDETKSSSTAEHEQEELEASYASVQSHHSVAAPAGKDSGLTDNPHATELVALSESSTRPRLADANKDSTGQLPVTTKVLIYARSSVDPSPS